ncbi:MAG: cytochrome c biogenesis protein DipZ [Afipia felis]|nr:cytochrome c biogenesis protein DipZ [Afipia felis]
MLLFVLAYLGGVLTIISPCILPVLPFVFARADRPFLKSGLPMLVGMALTFAIVATLAAVAGGWAVAANEYGRIAALVLLALFGIALLFPAIADRVTQPLVALGGQLSQSADGSSGGFMPSLLLGVATGLLWAPCAGPVLGLILTGAALQGANIQTTFLLLAYAAGAATSLALALLVGGRVFAAMKRSLGAGEWVRRGLGVLVLVAVAAIALGVDTNYLANVSLAQTSAVEQTLIDKLRGPNNTAMMPAGGAMQPNPSMMMKANTPHESAGALPVEGTMPSLDGAVEWLNSKPLTAEALRGKVVLVDFWTYSCINCLRTIPYVRAWAEKYKNDGLVVIGVHTPEFAFEKQPANVKKAIADLKIDYPVAIDNNYAIWRAFDNMYWPAHYFIDAQGRIRHHHFGEGEYAKSEEVIRQLLREAGKNVPEQLTDVRGTGAEAAPDMANIKSPETYLGYDRAENFMSPGGAVRDESHDYAAGVLKLNDWSLAGSWTVDPENAALDRAGGAIRYRFHARDLHLVLGPGTDGKPVRFKVTIDGVVPGADHGVDTDANGEGIVTGQRLYQLVRQQGGVRDRTFEIQFLDPGVQAFAFTFG